jgi:hypothetical protein
MRHTCRDLLLANLQSELLMFLKTYRHIALEGLQWLLATHILERLACAAVQLKLNDRCSEAVSRSVNWGRLLVCRLSPETSPFLTLRYDYVRLRIALMLTSA